jgi:hypothetical protein
MNTITPEAFNKMPLVEKEKFVRQHVQGAPFVCGALVFKDYSIIVVYSVKGHFVSGEARAHDNRWKHEVPKLLQGREFMPVDGASFPIVKQAVQRKIFTASNRNN